MMSESKKVCLFLLVSFLPFQLTGLCQESLREYGKVLEFIDSSDDADLNESKFSGSLDTSIYSAWEICKRRSRKGNQEKYKSEFLGFVEARINSPIPDWWREKMFEIGVKKRIEKPTSDLPEAFQTKFGVCHLKNSDILVREDRMVECFNKQNGKPLEFSFEKAFGDDGSFDFEGVGSAGAAVRNNGQRIVCFNSPGIEAKRKLFAFSADGKLLFSKEVGTYQQKMLFNGNPWHGCVDVRCSGDRIFVFGCDGAAITLDVFSFSSRDCLLQFTTLY